jgi:Aspartyl protease/Tetratricopeptide repeat
MFRALVPAVICTALLVPLAANAGDTANADLLYSQGEFDQARAAYAAVPAGSPGYEAALRRLGAIALYANRLDEAERNLQLALASDPSDVKCKSLLAEVASRQGNFAEAADWFAKAGKPDRAAEFAAFGNAAPYRIVSGPGRTEISFVQTDPLPAVSAAVNGHQGLFLIDTGGPEIALDTNFATTAGIVAVGGEQGTFAGGRRAPISFGRIAQFGIASLEVADVPAVLLNTAAYSAVTGGKPVAGVIGTEFLSRFLATINYPAGKLVLAPRDVAPPSGVEIPFWMVGDHFILAQGHLNAGHPQMFLVDTGLAGFAFTGPASTLIDAGIVVPTPSAAGADSALQFNVDSTSLGDLRVEKLQGLYGPFPPTLETSLGVHIGGIISHAFFRPYAVTFDFARMRLYARKP